MEEGFLPHIEKASIDNEPAHEAGWSLSYHGWSRIAKLVSASKYENGGPFALSLVMRAVEVVRTRYPVSLKDEPLPASQAGLAPLDRGYASRHSARKEVNTIDGVVSVPPTKSGLLVEMFARQVADLLRVEYLPVLAKVRLTQEQKIPETPEEKAENVRNAFMITAPQLMAGRTILLIDDIYDSGVRRFGACEIAPQEQKGESKRTF
jgi:adenine/guanine phosphoribosyltransferase-like PRPP-binding protein